MRLKKPTAVKIAEAQGWAMEKTNEDLPEKHATARDSGQTLPLPRFCRIIGMLWICSLLTYLFCGNITYAGGMPPLIVAVCVAAVALWIASSVLLVAVFVRSVWRSRSNAIGAYRPAMARWFSSVGSGLLGGVAALQVNHLFPGEWTHHSEWLPCLLLFSLVGMLVGTIPLAFFTKSRTAAIFAFILSAAFSWLIIVNNFR